jgi:ABC-type transport system involved in multi-copper enzyme maturation permease subunit
MKNVIKAQLYQLRKNRTLILGVVGINVICLTFAIMFALNNNIEYIEISGSSFAANLMSVTGTFATFIPPVIASMVCAGDFPDRTASNEISSGTVRKDAYFGRALLSIMLSMLLSLFTVAFPIIVISAVYGWGDTVPLWSVNERLLAALLPIFKSTCFCVMISFIIKKPAAIILAYAFLGKAILSSLVELGSRRLTDGLYSSFDIMNLLQYKSYMTYGLNDDKYVWQVYTNTLDGNMVAKIALWSVLMGIAFLYAGYYYHKKDDLN